MAHDSSDDSVLGARAATFGALLVVAAFVAAKAGRDAIVLSTFKVKVLPIFVGTSALVSFPIILITGKLLARFGPGRLIPLANLASAGAAVLEWSLIDRYPEPTAVAVFFHLSITGAVLVSGFWSIVNERFDLQAAKRHMARIGMGATLGGIAGGLIAERTAVYARPETILLVVAGMQVACAIALSLFGDPARAAPIVIQPGGMLSALHVIRRTALLRRVAGVVILGATAACILDYVFKADIVAGASKEDLLRALAIFYMVTNALTAIVQLVIGGAVIARLGVPRSAASLPLTVGVFGAMSLAIPGTVAAVIARGAELVVRNSIFRGAYELLYAPLTHDVKRHTKVLVDVGAERAGDIVGAQFVALLVYTLAVPRGALLIGAVVAAAAALTFALRLRASYASSLATTLIAGTAEPIGIDPALVYESERWLRLRDAHTFGQSADFPTVSLIRIPADRVAARLVRPVATTPSHPGRVAGEDPLLPIIAALRSGDVAAIRPLLRKPLAIEAAPYAVDLIATDELARAAIAALTRLAPHITGALVDALLDQQRDLAVRRRLPAVLAAGDPEHAAWGLWRGLADASFEVRYRCGIMLARQAGSGWLDYITADQVYTAVSRELAVDRAIWTNHRLLVDDLAPTVVAAEGEAAAPPEGTGLDHVFTLLGLVLPPEPLQIALHAVQTDDSVLRGTALEYLASVLPSQVRTALLPLIADEPDRIIERARLDGLDAVAAAAAADRLPRRSPEELIAVLRSRAHKTSRKRKAH